MLTVRSSSPKFPDFPLDARTPRRYNTRMNNTEKDKQFDKWADDLAKKQEGTAQVQSMIDAIFGKYK